MVIHPKALTAKKSFICQTLYMRKYCLASLKAGNDKFAWRWKSLRDYQECQCAIKCAIIMKLKLIEMFDYNYDKLHFN